MAGPPTTGKPVIQPGSHSGVKGPGKGAGKPTTPAMAGPGVPANSPLLNPGSSLSGQDLYEAAKALADAQTVGPYSELAKQIAANQQQTQNAENLTGGYFNQFGQQAKQGLRDETGIAGQLSSQLAGIGAGTQQQLAGLGQGAQAALARYTPQSDQSFASPAMQSLTAEIARQQGLAAQSSGNAQGAGAIQGANYRGLAASNLGTGALAGQEALSNIAQAGQLKNEPLTAKQASLRESEGALLADDLGKLRQQEITNKFTAAGLNVNLAKIQAQAQQDAAARRAARQNALLSQQGANQRNAATIAGENARSAAAIAARQAAAAAKASGTGGTKPLTTNEQNSQFKTISEMQALIQQGVKAGHSHGQISQALQTGQLQKGFPAQSLPLINAAFELVNYGYIFPHTAQALRQMGLRPQQHGLKIGQPGSPPSAATGAATGAAGAGAAGAGNAVGQAGQGAARGVTGAA